MDSYDLQRTFQKHLSRLNASSKSTENATQFLLRHPQDLPTLLSCITTTLGKEKINARMSIAVFILDLCLVHGQKLPLRGWIQRDILKIVDRSVPTRLGAAALVNIAPMRSVLAQLAPFLTPELVADASALLDQKESDPPSGGEPMSRDEVLKRMEDDRERTKKVKERKWQVLDGGEFQREWEALGGLTELDKAQMRMMNEVARVSRAEAPERA